MSEFLNDSPTEDKVSIVEYRLVEKETLLIDQVFDMLFEIVENQDKN
jgi:hypothetical protein